MLMKCWRRSWGIWCRRKRNVSLKGHEFSRAESHHSQTEHERGPQGPRSCIYLLINRLTQTAFKVRTIKTRLDISKAIERHMEYTSSKCLKSEKKQVVIGSVT